MNHDLLLTEIQKPEYKGLDLAGVVTGLRGKSVAVPVKAIPYQKVIQDLVTGGNYAQAKTFIGLTKDLFPYVDPQAVLEATFLGGLVAAGAIDQVLRDAIERYRVEAVPLLETLECAALQYMDDSSAEDHIQLAKGEDPQSLSVAPVVVTKGVGP